MRHSVDGVAIVFHDDDLARCTDGVGAPELRTAEELGRLDAGSWFHPRFRDTRLPTLDALLGLCRRLDLGVNLELKTGPLTEPDTLVKATAQALDQGRPARGVVVSSFREDLLRAWRERGGEDDALALIWGRPDAAAVAAAERAGAARMHVDWRNLSPRRLRALRAAGFEVYAWTCNRPWTVARLWGAGLSGVITDRPDRFRGLLRSGSPG